MQSRQWGDAREAGLDPRLSREVRVGCARWMEKAPTSYGVKTLGLNSTKTARAARLERATNAASV